MSWLKCPRALAVRGAPPATEQQISIRDALPIASARVPCELNASGARDALTHKYTEAAMGDHAAGMKWTRH